jgi:chromosome partitioning protein
MDRLLKQLDVNEITPKPFERTWRISDVSKLLGVVPQTIRRAEEQLGIQVARKNDRRVGYSLLQIHDIRDHLGLSPRRPPHGQMAVIGVLSGKGGCSKTTFSVNLAQKLVIEGYRVLVIDADPQASATTIIQGLNPDMVYDSDNTIAPFMMGRKSSFTDEIQKTDMPGLSILPCCQMASIMDLEGAGGLSDNREQMYQSFWRLKNELKNIRGYDCVVIDTPPTVTYGNLRCLIASNILIHPIAPAITDLSSASGYENTLYDFLESLESDINPEPGISNGNTLDIYSRKYVISRYNKNLRAHVDFARLIRSVYPTYNQSLDELAEVSNTLNNTSTLYESSTAVNSLSTRRKALDVMDSLFDEVISDIKRVYRHPEISRSEKAEV